MFSGYHQFTDSKAGLFVSLYFVFCILMMVLVLAPSLFRHQWAWAWYGLAVFSVPGQVWGNWTLNRWGWWEPGRGRVVHTLHTITSYSSGSWYKCAQMRVVTCSGARTEWRLGHYCVTAPRPWHGHCLSDDINTVTLISLCNSYHLTDNNRWHCAVVCMCIAVAAGLIEFYQCCKL